MIRIALLEDHEILRNLTAKFLESNLVSNVELYSDSNMLISKIKEDNNYDIVIIDLKLDFGDGFQLLDEKNSFPINLKTIIHTSNKDVGIIRHCIKLGTDSIVSKSSNENELINAIESVNKNKKYLCPIITSILNNANRNIYQLDNKNNTLTKREREVLNLIWQNKSTTEISEELFIAYYTVESYRKAIKRKLGANTLIETLRKGLELGYITT